MVRTTINLDPTVLRELKERAECEGKTLGDMASVLLARALREEEIDVRPLKWHTSEGSLVNLDDPEVQDVTEEIRTPEVTAAAVERVRS